MKSTLIIIVFFWSLFSFSKPSVIVAGDSWAFLPCFFSSVDVAFEIRQMDVEIAGCLSTSKAGARADNFKGSKAYNQILKLIPDKNIRAVYLSLGGNDMFNHWSNTMTSENENQLFLKIKSDIDEIIGNIHAVRPDLNVLISGYDYGYLYDKNPIKAYREIFENMGKPTAAEINSAFFRLSKVLNDLTSNHTAFIQHYGLMHYYFGAPEAGVGPYQTLPPDQISTPQAPLQTGGVPTVRNCPAAMLHIFDWYTDPHHLSPTGFDYLFGHAIDLYLADWLGLKNNSGSIILSRGHENKYLLKNAEWLTEALHQK